ncbi:glutaredoxin [Cystobasidium minutum MCA 4210]|uniref:glutaredoxin n=1 Tax=Cystobasidium minutum MCA 4210 TaxID=1397322 RepID=UPI0034CF153C|eukprot:jgi/Rhomi1/192514/gm1.728_g
MSKAQETAQKLIQEHDVAIFSKSYCPYCRKAKIIIKGLELDESRVGILELDEMGQEGADIQDYLEKETGQRTVPSVWIKQKFIGGSSDLAAISEDKLLEMVN